MQLSNILKRVCYSSFASSTDARIYVAVWCIFLMAGQLLFDVWGFVWVAYTYGSGWVMGP